MRIVHFSDWHGESQYLPPADVYVCTGDMYPDGAEFQQIAWAKRYASVPGFLPAPHPSSLAAPVVCVRGNHDRASLAPLLQHFAAVYQFGREPDVYTVAGVTFAGHRGVPEISPARHWSDEVSPQTLLRRWARTPDARVYLTHYPPRTVLDYAFPFGQLGLNGLTALLEERGERALHCFGHIHEAGGRTAIGNRVTYSNAATAFNVLDVEP